MPFPFLLLLGLRQRQPHPEKMRSLSCRKWASAMPTPSLTI